MDEKPDQIMNHIESQRDQLGRNLNELEERVRRTTDWRAQVDRNPMLAMGVAFGGGLLIGSMVGGSRRSHRSTWSSSAGKSLFSGESGFVEFSSPPVLVEQVQARPRHRPIGSKGERLRTRSKTSRRR